MRPEEGEAGRRRSSIPPRPCSPRRGNELCKPVPATSLIAERRNNADTQPVFLSRFIKSEKIVVSDDHHPSPIDGEASTGRAGPARAT